MKKKTIFEVVLLAILLLFSIGTVGMYKKAQDFIYTGELPLSYYVERNLDMLAIQKTKLLDPSYEYVTFDDSISKETQNYIKERLDQAIDTWTRQLDEDVNFQYKIEQVKTGKTIVSEESKEYDWNAENASKGNYVFARQSYNSKGNVEINENSSYVISQMLEVYMTDYFSESYDRDLGYTYHINDEQISEKAIQFHNPKNIVFTYRVPKTLEYNGGMIVGSLNDLSIYVPYLLLMFGTFTVVMFLYIFLCPIGIVEEAYPFRMIRKWKGEWNLLLVAMGIFFSVFGCCALTMYTMNGALLSLFHELNLHTVILKAGNILMWLIAYVCITCGLFDIKYILAHGVWRFMKEDTLIGGMCRGVSQFVEKITRLDFSAKSNRTVLIYTGLNAGVILLMVWYIPHLYSDFVSLILVFLYGVISFVWLKRKFDDVLDDYTMLVSATKELANGNFDTESYGDCGVFHELKSELDHVGDGFEKAIEEETKSQKMKTELISNVSHDLKTPLTCIKNYVELLQDETVDSEKRQEYVATLNQYADRLSAMIDDLFEVSKVNSGTIQLDYSELNIVALIEQAQAECIDLLEKKNLTVLSSESDRNILLTLDGNKTYRIFENIFTNIGKYAMPNSRVYLKIQEMDDSVEIEVKNVSETQMDFSAEEIMERFIRGDKSRHEGGSGLGLSIIKSFVEVQNGKFFLDIDGDLFKTKIIFYKKLS